MAERKEGRADPGCRSILFFSLGITLCFLAVLNAFGWLISRTGFSQTVRFFLYAALEMLLSFLIYAVFRRILRRGEDRSLPVARFLFCFLCLGLPCLAVFTGNLFRKLPACGVPEILLAVFRGLAVGLCEELLFRGVSFHRLRELFSGRKNAALTAALISSLAFGLAHLQNVSAQPASETVQQVCFAFANGMCFCGIYRISGTLLIPILLHGITDFGFFLPAADSLVQAASCSRVYMGLTALILAEGIALLILAEKGIAPGKENPPPGRP